MLHFVSRSRAQTVPALLSQTAEVEKRSRNTKKGLPEQPEGLSIRRFPGEGYAALRERAASTKGRYFSLSFIQCVARPFASASLASGKVTKGTRVGPTLQ